MYDSFENKSKIFTHVVSKEPIEVILHTSQFKIQGQIHVRPEDRLKDELDQAEMFLPVTSATVFSLNDEILYKTDFLAVNRSHIIWIIPVHQMTPQANPEVKDGED